MFYSHFMTLWLVANLEAKHFLRDLQHFTAFGEMFLETAYTKASGGQASDNGYLVKTKSTV